MADEDDVERSGSGAQIYRHGERKTPFTPPDSAADHCEEITTHVEKHIGKVDFVWHEIVSDLVHIDILSIPATDERPCHWFVTSGVSDLPMTVPQGHEEFARVELMFALPRDWPISQDAFKDEANYWPLRWLKLVGRLPHEYQTWIGYGHTIPHGDPPKPIADTKFVGVMLTPPYHLSPEFFRLDTDDGHPIHFFALTPMYPEELDIKLEKGAEEIEKRFEKQEIGFVLDKDRPNVALKRGWFKW
jgi:hypothetical protein